MAQQGMWDLAKEKTMKERGELPNEEGDVVREYRAMHEEDFWSSWLREDEKSKEEREVEAEGKGEEEGDKRKREEDTEEKETVTVKRRCEGFVSVEAFEILSQGRDVESCGDLSWEHLLEEPEDLSDCEPASCELVCAVLGGSDVIDVLVSLRLWSLSCVTFLPVALIGTAVLFFLQKACTLWYSYAGRDEVRRLNSESTPRFQEEG